MEANLVEEFSESIDPHGCQLWKVDEKGHLLVEIIEKSESCKCGLGNSLNEAVSTWKVSIF